MWLESSSLGAQVMLNSQVEMLNSLKFDGDVCWLGPMKQGSWISEFDPFPCFLSAFFCRVLISTGRGARWGGGARVYAWSPRLASLRPGPGGERRLTQVQSGVGWLSWADIPSVAPATVTGVLSCIRLHWLLVVVSHCHWWLENEEEWERASLPSEPCQ